MDDLALRSSDATGSCCGGGDVLLLISGRSRIDRSAPRDRAPFTRAALPGAAVDAQAALFTRERRTVAEDHGRSKYGSPRMPRRPGSRARQLAARPRAPAEEPSARLSETLTSGGHSSRSTLISPRRSFGTPARLSSFCVGLFRLPAAAARRLEGLRCATVADRSRLPVLSGRSHVAFLNIRSSSWAPDASNDYEYPIPAPQFERKANGVVLITINRPEVRNATHDRLHWELTQVCDRSPPDDDARVAVVTVLAGPSRRRRI